MKRLVVLLIVLGLLTSASVSQAVSLLNEDFTGENIANGLTVNLKNNPGITTDDNLDTWIDFPTSLRWNIVTEGGNSFAQHLVQTSDNTNLLYYALDISGLAIGTAISGSFDYVTTNRDGAFFLAGMSNGDHSLDPFAPWFPPGDSDDGIVLAKLTLTQGTSWTHLGFTHTLSQQYNAIVVAFEMGGTTGFRAVDNVSLNASVPEPSTLLLLGSGLLGLVGLNRRRKA